MGRTSGLLRKGAFALLLGAGGFLAGCDDARERLATAVRPASAQDVAAAVRRQVGEGKFKEAHDTGADFLAARADAGGGVAWETAKASAQAGLADDAIRYATLALRANAIDGVALMAEPLLSPVHTDPRLVALATSGTVSAPAAASGSAASSAAPAGGASQATIGNGAVKASAGDVSVELPN
jgi:hypothetical protein